MNKSIVGVLVFVGVCFMVGPVAACGYSKTAEISIKYKSTGATIIKDSISMQWRDNLFWLQPPFLVTLGHTCQSSTPHFVPTPGCSRPISTKNISAASRTARKTNLFVYTLESGRQIKIIHALTGFNGGKFTVGSRYEMDNISNINYDCSLSVR